MAGVLDTVDQRTQLAGRNRLELLLFRIGGRQRYGINVFKVREVLECPPLRSIPYGHHGVRGLAHVRGRTLPVIDMGRVIGQPLPEDVRGLFIVVTEFNQSIQGFLVTGVDRIVNMNWEQVQPPPAAGAASYITAITQVDDDIIEIIDVEKVLSEICPSNLAVSGELAGRGTGGGERLPILVVDDSSVARNMIARTLEQIGIRCVLAASGREGLALLQQWASEGTPIRERLALVVTDIEMPEMDGYTLTREIKRDERLKSLHVILHSSLSGNFNDTMAKHVGADQFLPKFHPDDLARAVLDQMDISSPPGSA